MGGRRVTRGYEVVAAALVEQGVEAFFGVMGEGNLDLVAELVEVCGVRYYAMPTAAAWRP
jgi:thiamine pyrophosphate-dependent acetolactate synthase large subunit-like protein